MSIIAKGKYITEIAVEVRFHATPELVREFVQWQLGTSPDRSDCRVGRMITPLPCAEYAGYHSTNDHAAICEWMEAHGLKHQKCGKCPACKHQGAE
jgi:hypothetical protein